MHEQMLRDILRRLNALERTSARVRVGEVTDTGPLDVALGGSDTSYEDVKAVDGLALETGDQVVALLWGNDLLVLGALGGPAITRGTDTLSFSASATSVTKTITHGLGTTPVSVAVISNVSSDFVVMNTVDGSFNATTFQVSGRTNAGGTMTQTPRFYWVAIA